MKIITAAVVGGLIGEEAVVVALRASGAPDGLSSSRAATTLRG
jgi:hypothetical protein